MVRQAIRAMAKLRSLVTVDLRDHQADQLRDVIAETVQLALHEAHLPLQVDPAGTRG